jgi:hypothetical protein
MIEFLEKIAQFESLVVAVITGVTTFLAVWFRNRLSCKTHIRKLESTTKRNEDVLAALEYALVGFNADRAYIYEFHNGSHFSSGLPQQKFSCTYEKVSEGISSECGNTGEYRISNFNDYIRTMLKDGHYWGEDVTELRDYGLRSLLQDKGVRSVYNVPIKTLSGQTIGFLGLDYVKSNRLLTQEEKTKFKTQAKLVSGYLLH